MSKIARFFAPLNGLLSYMLNGLFVSNTGRIQSDAALELGREIHELSGYSWDRVHRASIYKDGVNVVSRQKLIALRIKETGK
jgi:hypothetical protein